MHLISAGAGSHWCSCGQQFPDAMTALDHALPLNTADLAAKVRADPSSSPELIASTSALAEDAAIICS